MEDWARALSYEIWRKPVKHSEEREEELYEDSCDTGWFSFLSPNSICNFHPYIRMQKREHYL